MMDSIRFIFHGEDPPSPPPLPGGERVGVRGVEILRRKQNLVSEAFFQFG
jgi:hypothetical protein